MRDTKSGVFTLNVRFFGLLITALCAIAQPMCAAASSGAALQGVMAELRAHSSPEQYEMFQEAIDASPVLARQLNELADDGRLRRFAVGDPSDLPPKTGPFSAWISGTTWAFTPQFVQKQAKTRVYDVVQPGDILPDNMVFALGHLAYKAETMAAVEASLQALKAQASAPRQQQSVLLSQPTNLLLQVRDLHMNNEAGAFIKAWNDTVDAAVHENGGKELTVKQAVTVLLNLRYRSVFVKAMESTDHRLTIANNGYVEANQANLAAMVQVLSTSPVYDVQ
jgi:hypothetical protein